MTRLPSLRPRQIVSALERCGFTVIRITGSHYQLFNERTRRHTTVLITIAICHAELLRPSFGKPG